MGEIIIGMFAILVGALFCFSGNALMRILFPFMGFFAGFSAGAGMITAISGDRFLGTVLGWVVGFFAGILFAVLAYFFYAFAIVLAFAGFGFAVTSGLLTLLNLDWNWLVVLLGTAVGVLFGITAIVMSLPLMVLVVATGFFGSAVVIYGLMLVFNTASLGDFSNGTVLQAIKDNVGLYILWVTLAITGSIAQTRMLNVEAEQMRGIWDSSKSLDELLAQSKK